MKASLEEIVDNKRAEIAARQQAGKLCTADIKVCACAAQGTAGGRQSMLDALAPDTSVRLIAEIKPRSPSGGELRVAPDLLSLAGTYSRHAAAISVLTDEKYFGGSMQALTCVARSATVPVLCKEFIIDRGQLHEAKVAGASAALLIVKILDAETLAALREEARVLDLAAIVEVQDQPELARALQVGPDVVLINNRNLSNYEIDLQTTAHLAPLVPSEIPVVSASGIESQDDIRALLPYTNKFLVGSCLMRAANVEGKLKELCASC